MNKEQKLIVREVIATGSAIGIGLFVGQVIKHVTSDMKWPEKLLYTACGYVASFYLGTTVDTFMNRKGDQKTMDNVLLDRIISIDDEEE